MRLKIEFDREEDGRHIAEIPSFPGVLAYGVTREEAEAKVEVLALRVIADQMERDNRSTPRIEFTAA